MPERTINNKIRILLRHLEIGTPSSWLRYVNKSINQVLLLVHAINVNSRDALNLLIMHRKKAIDAYAVETNHVPLVFISTYVKWYIYADIYVRTYVYRKIHTYEKDIFRYFN